MTDLPAVVDLAAQELSARIDGDTLTVTIDRPEKRNALTADGYHGIKRAAMIVADEPQLNFLVITGAGDVLEPEHSVAAIGSGGNYALAAARGMMDSDRDAETVARDAMKIASDICVYTNGNLTVEKIKP